ncbi:MAG: ABC transporter permease [Candidatus Peribacteraceae bacterium]|nr:ABC transporter permease [Candidatus Peribacteraceae bacterium]MDD5741887.1 ABC transporter permease [Candidatus Peribacteraceae bacterium]
MQIRDTIIIALRAIRANRSRAFLTMLGIIIGVGAVVLMTSIGRSMEGVILGQISALGPKTIALWPGNKGPEGGGGGLNADLKALTFSDVDALKKLSTITNIAPMIFVTGDIGFGRETSDSRIIGVSPENYQNQKVDIASGRFHDETDETEARAVAVLGPDTATDLFGNQDPLGKRIDLGGRKYTVIGVLTAVGSQFFQNMDKRVIIPLSTAKIVTQHSYVDMVTAQATGDLEDAVVDIQTLLRRRHSITLPSNGGTDNDDFLVRTAAQAQEILSAVSVGLTLFITMIAAVSLVVGGIGIMNIMLVAVTERTREIGLRKALGAQPKDIMMQFLVEAVVLTVIGGIVGTAIGIGLDYLIVAVAKRFLADYAFILNFGAMIIALATAAATGLVFGIYPARKAAELNPIEALRYE